MKFETDAELPGMWESADFIGGETDAIAKHEGEKHD